MSTEVKNIMATDLVTASPFDPVDRISAMMRQHDLGNLPVVDDGDLTGIVTDRDIVIRCVAMGRQPAATFASDVCSPELHTIGPEDSTKEAAAVMRQHALRRLPVVNGSKLVGMVSIGDLARAQDPYSPLADISNADPNR